MSDAIRQAVELYGGAVSLVPGGIEITDASKLQSEATDAVVWQAVFGSEEEQAGARASAPAASTSRQHWESPTARTT